MAAICVTAVAVNRTGVLDVGSVAGSGAVAAAPPGCPGSDGGVVARAVAAFGGEPGHASWLAERVRDERRARRPVGPYGAALARSRAVVPRPQAACGDRLRRGLAVWRRAPVR